MKYTPVFRYRAQERKVLLSTPISSKIIPLIEVVSNKLRSNSKKDCIDQLSEDIDMINTKIMLDFPMYIKLQNNTQPGVLSFLTPIMVNPDIRINLFKDQRLIAKKDKIIPVVSYNPNDQYISNSLIKQSNILRSEYNQQTFRIYNEHFKLVLNELGTVIKSQDYVILDLKETSHTHSANQNMYGDLINLSIKTGCKIILIRSAIPSSLTNVALDNGKIVYAADNSLLKEYKNLGFSAFGDYCGVKKDNLTKGGRISPGYIMYSWLNNSYYGFKGDVDNASSFEGVLIPEILKSNVWQEYLNTHNINGCLGCSTIEKISLKQKKGNSQPEWKGFACGHYLYTMEEFL
ncbi:hypothetical protein ACIP9G_13260 [Lysinibacillus sp. NPDC093197]|uniref:beta family protein n=1 Tax=Lysinibacillus sp. NPDC093197 TaxID=3364132 RepID=UPI0038279309